MVSFVFIVSALQVAANAASEGRGPLLGVLYDECTRKFWEDMSHKMGAAWEMTNVSSPLPRVLREACALYDSMLGLAGKVSVSCNICVVYVSLSF